MRTTPKQAGKNFAARLFKNKERCEEVINLFSFFSNRTRFKILCILNEGDYCVNELAQIAGGKMSNLSQQLKILTLAGFLEKQRKEKSVYYHLKDKKIRNLLRFLYEEYARKEA